MVDTDNAFFKVVAPSLGMVVANILFLAPIKTVVNVIRSGELGDLNPVPYPLIAANCSAWIAYSMVLVDPFIFFSNIFGMVLGFVYTLGTYGLATRQVRIVLMSLLTVLAGVIATVGFIGVWADLDKDGKQQLWGLTANIILVLFYSAPMTTIWGVMRTRDSSSLHWPLALMTVINGTLWVCYGVALFDGYIWIPNLVGAIFGAVQLALIVLLPAKRSRAARIARLQDAEKRAKEPRRSCDVERDGAAAGPGGGGNVRRRPNNDLAGGGGVAGGVGVVVDDTLSSGRSAETDASDAALQPGMPKSWSGQPLVQPLAGAGSS